MSTWPCPLQTESQALVPAASRRSCTRAPWTLSSNYTTLVTQTHIDMRPPTAREPQIFNTYLQCARVHVLEHHGDRVAVRVGVGIVEADHVRTLGRQGAAWGGHILTLLQKRRLMANV